MKFIDEHLRCVRAPLRRRREKFLVHGREQVFWRRVIADYSGGAFAEHVLTEGWWQGRVQCFTAGALPADQTR